MKIDRSSTSDFLVALYGELAVGRALRRANELLGDGDLSGAAEFTAIAVAIAARQAGGSAMAGANDNASGLSGEEPVRR
jgi:hypothetical protein